MARGSGSCRVLSVAEARAELCELKKHFRGRCLVDVRSLFGAYLLCEDDARVMRRILHLEWLLDGS